MMLFAESADACSRNAAILGSSSEAYRLLAGDGEAAVEVRRKNRSVDVTVAKHSRRPGVFVFRAGDGDEEHEDEVEVEVNVGEAH